MKWFLYAISLFCVTIGCCTILYTNESRNVLRNIFNKIDRKILSAFEAVMGILLVVSATASHHSWLIRLIGFMAVIEGVVIFFIPKNLYDELIDWYLNSASDQTYRLFGIVTLILGTAVLSWIL
ncbi:MAG: DUF2065 family protein [Thermodesulfobacteriota bacterium]|nr:DUF2065 family protein [Thermodesulfobacteriota bacterium]